MEGDEIRTLREELGVSQQELARRLQVAHSTVNRWENGHIEPSRLARKAMQGLAAQAAIPLEFDEGTAPLIGHVGRVA